MALPIVPLLGAAIGAAARGLGGIFVRRRTIVAEDGAETTRREATPFSHGAIRVLLWALLWHFLIHPILNYKWPEIGFPAIDAALIHVLAGLGG